MFIESKYIMLVQLVKQVATNDMLKYFRSNTGKVVLWQRFITFLRKTGARLSFLQSLGNSQESTDF